MANVLVVDPGELGELLATLLGQYGMNARRARSGEEALEQALASPPEVVIIEQDLPDASGVDVAELLCAELAVKTILMYPQQLVAEPDDELLARIGALDGSFLRPFRSLTLVEFVAKLLDIELPASTSTSADDAAPARDSARALSSMEGASPHDGEELLLDVALDDAITSALDGALGSGAQPPPSDSAPTSDSGPLARPLKAKIAARSFAPGGLTDLWERVKARRETRPAQPAVGPDTTLNPRALADALDAFHQSQTTGELWLQNGRARRVLFLRRGVITRARSNVDGEDVMGLLLRHGLVAGDAVLTIRDDLKSGRAPSVLDALLARKLVAEPDLRRVVHEHTRLVALRAFLWRQGSLRVSFEGRSTREPVFAQVPVGDVIVRGILVTESVAVLEEAAPDDARFTPATDAGHGLHDLTLSASEARIVIAMDGTKTIRDLCLLFDDVEPRIIRGLAAGLLCIGLLRFAGWGHAAAREISYF